VPDPLGRLLPHEAADRLGVHVNTIRNWARDGLIKVDRLPGSGYMRIPLGEVVRVEALRRGRALG
jgi:excisionase family DNA binding protein